MPNSIKSQAFWGWLCRFARSFGRIFCRVPLFAWIAKSVHKKRQPGRGCLFEMVMFPLRSIGGFRREEDLLRGGKEDFNIHQERPLVDVEHVVADSFFEEGEFGYFTAVALALGEAGDAGFHVVA